MGYFLRHILHGGGGAKLPTHVRIFPEDPFLIKLDENVITTLIVTFSIAKSCEVTNFLTSACIFVASGHISAKNTSVTKMLVN